jgi:hypothetical protein
MSLFVKTKECPSLEFKEFVRQIFQISGLIGLFATTQSIWPDVEIHFTQRSSSNSVARGTNWCVMKVSTNGSRTDFSALFSVIDLPMAQTRFELYHWKKQFIRRTVGTHMIDPAINVRVFVTTNQVQRGSNLVQMLSWKSEGENGAIYLCNVSVYGQGLSTNEIPRLDLVPGILPVGFIANGCLIVQSEVTTAFASSTNPVVAVPVQMKLVTELVGLKEKEFPASDFQVPSEYKEVTVPPESAIADAAPARPDILTQAEMDQRIKDFANGAPVLKGIPAIPSRSRGIRLRIETASGNN